MTKTFMLLAGTAAIAATLARSPEFAENLGAATATAQMGYTDGLAGRACGTGLVERTGANLRHINPWQDLITQASCDAGRVKTAFARGLQTAQFTAIHLPGTSVPATLQLQGPF